MKKYFFGLYLALFQITSGSSQIPTDTLYGNVKSLREKIVFLNKKIQTYKLHGDVDGDYGHSGFLNPTSTINHFKDLWYKTPFVHYANYYKEFFENGKAAKETWYFKNGKPLRTYKYDYDDSLNLIRKTEIYTGSSFVTYLYKYNNFHQLITDAFYTSFHLGTYRYTFYDYDSANKLIQSKNHDDLGEMTTKKYVYNNNGLLIRILAHEPYVLYLPNGRVDAKRDKIGTDHILKEYRYDSIGNLTEEHFYSTWLSNRTNPLKIVKYSYDEFKNLTQIETTYDTDSAYTRKLFYYNSSNQLIKEISEKVPKYINDVSVSTGTIQYFYTGNNLTRTVYKTDEETKTIDFTYEYDKKGNWIKQTKSLNSQPLFIWKRALKYYH